MGDKLTTNADYTITNLDTGIKSKTFSGLIVEYIDAYVTEFITPVGDVYRSWKDGRRRSRWLQERPVKIRTATENKSMRLDWSDEMTILSVHFYSKGPRKCQVVVQHTKLSNARAADRMKAYWSDALDRLKGTLEG